MSQQRKVTMYSFEICPYCDSARSLLKSLNVNFEEIKVGRDDDAKREELVRKSGMRTFPQVFVEDECLGGFTDIRALHDQGKLVSKIFA